MPCPQPGAAMSCLTLPLVAHCLALSFLALCYHFLSLAACLTLPALTALTALPCLALPCLALNCLELPCPALHCPFLFYASLPCLTLPCLAMLVIDLRCPALSNRSIFSDEMIICLRWGKIMEHISNTKKTNWSETYFDPAIYRKTSNRYCLGICCWFLLPLRWNQNNY